MAYLCSVAWDVSINLPHTLQRRSYGIMTKATPKSTTGVKKIKGLSVIEDRAYARATYTATYLFMLDYVKRTKATYHDRWPTNDQVREWKARMTRAWKYSTMAQKEVWDMKAREHDNQQPLIAERVIQLGQSPWTLGSGVLYQPSRFGWLPSSPIVSTLNECYHYYQ
jgi:hypothetical protein